MKYSTLYPRLEVRPVLFEPTNNACFSSYAVGHGPSRHGPAEEGRNLWRFFLDSDDQRVRKDVANLGTEPSA